MPVEETKLFQVSIPWWVHTVSIPSSGFLRHINLLEWLSVCKPNRFFLRGWCKKLSYIYHKTWSSASTQPFNQLTPDTHQSSFLFWVAPERGVHWPLFFPCRGVFHCASMNQNQSLLRGNYSQSIWYIFLGKNMAYFSTISSHRGGGPMPNLQLKILYILQ